MIHWNFQKYSVKIIYAIIECVWDFQNNALWDTQRAYLYRNRLQTIHHNIETLT